MSETHFSKLDWRPGKRRATYPRVRDWGGQKTAPDAFLEAGRRYGFGQPGNDRRCLHCRRFCVREASVCRMHAGAAIASKRRPFVPGQKGLRRRALGVPGEPLST